MQTTPADFRPRAGAVRYFNDTDQSWHCANPGSPMFSTLTFLATEFYDGQAWRQIWSDDEQSAAPEVQ